MLQTGIDKTYHGEEPLDLQGADVAGVEHHTKKHVFRLITADSATYLFDARSDVRLRLGLSDEPY